MAFVDFRNAQAGESTLDARLKELVRLRIAFHNQYRSCMAIRYPIDGDAVVDEDLVWSLEKPHTAENLTDAEKSAIAFADKFATNHYAIGDADYADLRRHFSEPELVELGLLCALSVGIGRLSATWHMVDEIPAAFREAEVGQVKPWMEQPIEIGKREPA